MTVLSLLALIFALVALFAEAAPTTSKPAVLLVPGAFHKARVYGQVKDLLNTSGYKSVDAIELPSVGPLAAQVGRTPDIAVVKALVLARLAAGQDVVLVGNSYGATVISEAVKGLQSRSATATNPPRQGKILGLVMVRSPTDASFVGKRHPKKETPFPNIAFQLSGFIPYITEVTQPGSRPDIRVISPPWFRFQSTELAFWDGDMVNSPPSFTFYNLLSASDASYWTNQLEPSSFAALNATATFIPYTGAFRCLYVVAQHDNAVTPALAQTYLEQPGAQFETLTIDADHIPMLSRPQTVVEIIRRFAGEVV